MKKKLSKLVLLLFAVAGYSQQDSQFTQYMYNTVNINPAYAGSRGVLSIFGLHRAQWVGLDGAPQTTTASLNTPIEGTSLGLGVSVINDRIGISEENNIAVDVSYSIPTSEKFKLSFGLKGSANLLNVDYTKLNYLDQGDLVFLENIENKFSPNIGVGVYYHSDATYIGLSLPNILETSHYDKYESAGNSRIAKEQMHLYLIAGHVFDLSGSVKFKPSLLTKAVSGSPLQVDLSANFLFNEKFVAGVAYRWDAAYSAMVGVNVSDSWFIGYGYDRDSTGFADYNGGSHEIFLRYEFKKREGNLISPRFF